jgi:hypothetical protein
LPTCRRDSSRPVRQGARSRAAKSASSQTWKGHDTFAKVEPRLLHRKGGVGKQVGYPMATIADYGWSAALYVALANGGVE